jgi:hypothetical protein
MSAALYPRRNIPGTHFYQRLSRSQDHSAAGTIRSIEKSDDLIGNRTRDLPACSVVPQPTGGLKLGSDCWLFGFMNLVITQA